MARYSAMLLLMAAVLGLAPRAAHAGPYADDMAKCLVRSTSPQDRSLLVQWIFSAMTVHPDLAGFSKLPEQKRDQLNRDAGALFQRLLVESCRSETQQALRNEGNQTIEYAFSILGQVATRGLFADSAVAANLASVNKFIDMDKIKALASP